MKWLLPICFSLLITPIYAQITLGYYDLPSRGQNYYQNNIVSVQPDFIPQNVYDSTLEASVWDFTGVEGDITADTLHYYWVEGTSAAFDFPDANMVDMNPDGDNSATYFIKNESGFYFSGQDGAFQTQMGNANIKAEFRPAVPIIKVPAKMGDEVSETSRATVDLLTLGKVSLTTNMHYSINGYGKVVLPGDEEFEVLRIKRITATEALVRVTIFGQEIVDTTHTLETAYEFYTNGYGDAIAKVTITYDDNLGLQQYNFSYKDHREVSAITPLRNANDFFAYHLASQKLLLVQAPEFVGGTLEVLSLDGKSCLTMKCAETAFHVGTESLHQGIYLVKATDAQGQVSIQKIMIN